MNILRHAGKVSLSTVTSMVSLIELEHHNLHASGEGPDLPCSVRHSLTYLAYMRQAKGLTYLAYMRQAKGLTYLARRSVQVEIGCNINSDTISKKG